MSFPVDAPFVSRPGSSIAAGAMALGVHAVFMLLLVFGVTWQTQPPTPVMVDLWEALPSKPRPISQAQPPSEPKPKPERQPVAESPSPPVPVKIPESAKAVAPPKPVIKEPSPAKTPDIALDKKKAEAEWRQKLKAMQAAEEKALADAVRAENETMKLVREKQLAEQKKRELLRQMEEEDLLQEMADGDAENEARLMRQTVARAMAGKRQAELASLIRMHRDEISAKVRGHTRLPEGLKSNLEVRCLVKLLPTGEVRSVRVTQSSDNAAFDEAVVRAIEKSSPLPLPADRDARTEFLPELSLVHRSNE